MEIEEANNYLSGKLLKSQPRGDVTNVCKSKS